MNLRKQNGQVSKKMLILIAVLIVIIVVILIIFGTSKDGGLFGKKKQDNKGTTANGEEIDLDKPILKSGITFEYDTEFRTELPDESKTKNREYDDLSAAGNKSVLGYYDNSKNKYFVYNNQNVTGEVQKVIAPEDCSYLFSSSMYEIKLSNLDTSNVTNMSHMFYQCNNLEELDLSEFDTSNVTDMSYMFYDCTVLEELDVSNFDT